MSHEASAGGPLARTAGSDDEGAATGLRYDPRAAAPFVEKSLSEHTRRAYRLAVAEFFRHSGMKHPAAVTPADVIGWRDELVTKKRAAATVAFKLTVVRSFFEHLRAAGLIILNPASTKLVSSPALPEGTAGRALSPREALMLLSGPDRRKAEGARDYALMLAMLMLGLRVSEACSLRASSVRWSHGRWTLRVKVKGGRERTLPLPQEVKKAIDDYLRLDAWRRRNLHSGGAEAFILQPHSNYRTLEFAKALSARMAHLVVAKWGDYCGLGRLSPHDLRRTAITRALVATPSRCPTRCSAGSYGRCEPRMTRWMMPPEYLDNVTFRSR